MLNDCLCIILLFCVTKCRVLNLMKHAASSVTIEEVIERHKPPSTQLYSRFSAEQVTFGKVQGSIQASSRFLVNVDCLVTLEGK